jgi:two-component system nitrogen regulation sensor histidine kinase GlnL
MPGHCGGLPDRNLTVCYANPAAENLPKISNKNIVGHRLQEVFPDHALLSAAIQYAADHTCSYTQHDLKLTTVSLEKLEVSCTVTPTDSENTDGYLLEFNELHQQLRIAREERLHDQTEASRVLIRNLAHEIESVRGLRGAAQLEHELDGLEQRVHGHHEGSRPPAVIDRSY